jgi:hypothetical protein
MSPSLLADVVDHLRLRDVRFALIGAAAMAVHGVARSTFDVDLFTTDRTVLDDTFWESFPPERRARLEVRRGDADDPLAGAVRLAAEGQRTVDLVVGRGGWQEQVVRGARPTMVHGVTLPVAAAADLIALKLYAGGAQDAWDIEQLLGSDADGTVRAAVDRAEPHLPSHARSLWARLRAGR